MLFVDDVRERLIILPMDEHVHAPARAVPDEIAGDTVHDALLAHCASKVDAKTIYTSNLRHHRLCGEVVAERPRTP